MVVNDILATVSACNRHKDAALHLKISANFPEHVLCYTNVQAKAESTVPIRTPITQYTKIARATMCTPRSEHSSHTKTMSFCSY